MIINTHCDTEGSHNIPILSRDQGYNTKVFRLYQDPGKMTWLLSDCPLGTGRLYAGYACVGYLLSILGIFCQLQYEK